MGFFYLKIILLFFVLCYNSGVMVLYIGGVLMAYFLKVTKQQSRTYLSGVLQLNNINFFETLDIALFFCQFFCIFYSYFLVLCDIIVSGGVSYG